MTAVTKQTNEVPTAPAEEKQKNDTSPLSIFRNRNFRWLWLGEGISLLGDQFYLIALPWLVLQMTGDALAMGTVLALGGIPRALFMLVGGALSDRFSPRNVMLASNLIRMALVAVLAMLVIVNAVELWMLYIFALVFGLADAFFMPAQSAIVPLLVEKDRLQTGNAIVQGTMQLSLFLGPVLAGVLIAIFGTAQIGNETVTSTQGLGLAFAIDAGTFLVSALTLLMIRMQPSITEENEEQGEGVLTSIRRGLGYVWDDVALRSFFILIALGNFLIVGPITIGIPVLADTRFPEGAAAFGILMSAYGGGSLLGTILAGVLPRPPASIMGAVLGVIWSGMGVGVLSLALVNTTAVGAMITLAMGMANGYVVILFITWLQRRTPEAMMGRVMSLLMFASMGLLPVSNALTGGLIEWNTTALFMGSGALMVIIVFLMMLNPVVRAMES